MGNFEDKLPIFHVIKKYSLCFLWKNSGPLPSVLPWWIGNVTYTKGKKEEYRKRQNDKKTIKQNCMISVHSKRPHTIAKMNGSINMDSTI